MTTMGRAHRRPDPGTAAIAAAALAGIALLVSGLVLSRLGAFAGGTVVPQASQLPRPAVTAAPTVAARASAPGAVRPATTVDEIGRAASDVPPAIRRTAPAAVAVSLETREVVAAIGKDQTYAFWTFGGTVPGPFLRVRAGDTVTFTLKNGLSSTTNHSIDLHSVTGPGGGAGATQVEPGKDATFTWKAMNPGIYVYHCATAPIPVHIANGMYGLILVEPEGGLPPVDREFYVMQGELYTATPFGVAGHKLFGADHLLTEDPDYVLFNGRVGSLTEGRALTAAVGETIRLYVGVGGFVPSSFHVIGEIFDRVYPEGAVGSEPARNVQTTFIPAGGAAIVEFKVEVPGTYVLVDHSLVRALNKGAAGHLVVTGPDAPDVFSGGGGAGH